MITETLRNRFPRTLSKEIDEIEKIINLSSKYETYRPFEISLKKDILIFPMRIYSDPRQLEKMSKLTPTQKDIIYCFYSRHCDGYIRERCLVEIIESKNLFCIPFILQLLGEYIIEILQYIYNNRERINIQNLISYIEENPSHYEKTRQRVYSYWDCNYRWIYPKKKQFIKSDGKCYLDYPGIKMIKYIQIQLLGRPALTKA